MKKLVLVAAAIAATMLPAFARDFVQDGAGMFDSSTVAALNQRISNFNAQTGKEIVVQTVPSVSGGDVSAAAHNAFSQQQVNGVLIFISRDDRKDYIVPDRAAVQAGWWSAETSQSIASAMQAQFRAGDYNGGITTAVSMALNVYRSHLGSLRNSGNAVPQSGGYAQPASPGGVHISMFWIIILALVAFFVIRSIMRAASGPRYYGGPGPGGAPGPGYGPGYGYGGYGGWGGGGGFFSGLLGGLGGAWLGNEMFGRQNWGGGNVVDPNAGGGGIAPGDAGGWQSDAGQADMSGGGGGDWGGGGFGGGGGDFGGGFGGGDGGGGGGW